MQAYFELRRQLADLYPTSDDWRRAAKDINIEPSLLELEGSSLSAWSNILEAARTPQGMQSLSAFISRESPELLGLGERFAKEAENWQGSLPDLPELQSVDLTDDDLQPVKISASLNFSEMFPYELLTMSLAAGQPRLEDLDAAFSGENTAAAKERLNEFRKQLAKERSTLKTHHIETTLRLSQLESEIHSLERAPRPTEPIAPSSYPAGTSDQLKRFLQDQYKEKVERYRAAIAQYDADQANLGPLRAEFNRAERDANQLNYDIAKEEKREKADERSFLDDISEARDKDLLLELHQTLDKASAAFRAEKNPFKGFCTLLGASCLANLLEKIIARPDLAFARSSDALVQPIKDDLLLIAKGCLAGPAVVDQALAANRKTLAALTERLEKLPSAQLEARRERARQLLATPVPSLPDFAKLEDPDELNAVKLRIIEIRSSLTSYRQSVEAELDGEPAEICRAVEAAQADATSTIQKMRDLGAKNAEVRSKSDLLWKLVQHGGGNLNLPSFIGTLCLALPQEILRRFNSSIGDLVNGAVASDFEVRNAETLLGNHLLTAYVTDRDALRRRLADCERILQEIESAAGSVEDRFVQVANEYRGRVTILALLSPVPLIGLGASIWIAKILAQLKPLVASSKPAYVSLGDFVLTALRWTAAACGVVAVSAAAATIALYRGYLSGVSYQIVIGVTVACLASFAISLRNLWTARAQMHERKRLGPVPPAA